MLQIQNSLQQTKINATKIDGRKKWTAKLPAESASRNGGQVFRTKSPANCPYKHDDQSVSQCIYRSCKTFSYLKAPKPILIQILFFNEIHKILKPKIIFLRRA